MKLKPLLFGGLGALLLASPAYAHHSFAMFDMDKTVEIKGTIKEFIWSSPHSWVDVLVPKADGSTEVWALECGAPGGLTRVGWTKDSLKPGDKVSALVHPLRHDRAGGACIGFTFADGHQLKPGADFTANFDFVHDQTTQFLKDYKNENIGKKTDDAGNGANAPNAQQPK